ncbi:MAG TPA: VirK/YbjX family protein [Candidatus Aquabacterium excrementipullorum]|nr:VirK/YbjX family protein [Candidatus Aquabacterium excrementipullorum]
MSVLPAPKLPSAIAVPPAGAGMGLSWTGLRRDLFTKDFSGMLDGLRRLAHVAWHFRDHHRLLKVLKAEHTAGILRQVPRTAYRYTLPYLSSNFERPLRLELLMAHYRFMNDRLGAAFCAGIVQGTLTPWRAELQGHRFSIHVTGPCAISGHREGELTFALQMDGADLYKVSFSIVPARTLSLPSGSTPPRHGHTLYIGRVQGVVGTFEQIRLATKACHDIAPPDLLMAAVAGMAGALGIEVIAGVGIEHSISSESIQQSNMSFDYTEFWDRYHGSKTADGHHVMQLPFPEKPLQAIASKHRKRTTLKREFKRQITEATQACVARIATNL